MLIPRSSSLPLVVALVALTLAAPFAAQAQTGTITGVVQDDISRQPLSSVQVYIPSLDLGVLSQENGRYLLLNVPVGTHTLRAES
jgi:hypothetical protein